jgi:FKBP-type peptidyl-prolyl cis-trans isomerase FkpA
MKIKFTLLMLLLLVLSTACKKKFDAEEQAQIDEDIIVQYIADKSLDATPTGSGLYYTIDSLGSTVYPDINSTVRVAYKGYFTDGDVFDQSSASGVTFPLANVIKGWQEGIPLYKVDGGGKLLIPSALGYGNSGTGSIPANSVLIFDVHLIEVL